MAGNPKSDTTGVEKDITCIDDVPGIARLAARQQFLAKWYRTSPCAICCDHFIAYKFFPNSNSWTQVVLVFVAIIWGMAVAGYAFYLMFAVRCPVCKSRFGLGEKCRSCGLPRHQPAE